MPTPNPLTQNGTVGPLSFADRSLRKEHIPPTNGSISPSSVHVEEREEVGMATMIHHAAGMALAAPNTREKEENKMPETAYSPTGRTMQDA